MKALEQLLGDFVVLGCVKCCADDARALVTCFSKHGLSIVPIPKRMTCQDWLEQFWSRVLWALFCWPAREQQP